MLSTMPVHFCNWKVLNQVLLHKLFHDFFCQDIWTSGAQSCVVSTLSVEYSFTLGSRPQLVVVSGLSVGCPFTMGSRPHLVVVSGLSIGCPFMVGSRPQLVVVLGLSVGCPFVVGSRPSWSPCLSRSLFTKLLFSLSSFRLSGSPFANILFHTMEFLLSRSLPRFFLSRDGISAITKPFTNFSFTWWNFGYHIC
jgi:hypothetical protein